MSRTDMRDAFKELSKILDANQKYEIKPNVLNEKEVEVFDGNKKIKVTILQIDAKSSIQILENSKDRYGRIDNYKLSKQILENRVKEIENGEKFLEENSMTLVNNINEEIGKMDQHVGPHLKVIK